MKLFYSVWNTLQNQSQGRRADANGTLESLDEPSSGLKEEAILKIVMEEQIEITTAENCKQPMLLHC